MENTNIIQTWDAVPESVSTDPLQGMGTFTEWLTKYRDRLSDLETFNADYATRSKVWKYNTKTKMFQERSDNRGRSRDRTVLQTLCHLAEQHSHRVVEASAYTLTAFSGLHRDTIHKAITSLRKLKYLCVAGVVNRKDDGRHRPLRIVLDMYCLPAAQNTASSCISQNTICTGDFSHDAFGGHSGLKGNKRDVWSWFLDNPGALPNACHKATGIDKMTISRAVDWLIEELWAAPSAEGGIYSFPVCEREAALDKIARHRHLQGKTSERLHHARVPYWEIAARTVAAEKRGNWRAFRAQFDG